MDEFTYLFLLASQSVRDEVEQLLRESSQKPERQEESCETAH